MPESDDQENSNKTNETQLDAEIYVNTFLLHPVISPIIGIILGFVFGFSCKSWLSGLAAGILASIAAFQTQETIKAKRSISTIEKTSLNNINAIKVEVMQTLGLIHLGSGFKQLYNLAKGLPEKHFSFYKGVMQGISKRGGAIVVKAEQNTYLEHLTKILSNSNNSVLATLRGGRYEPTYTLDWFLDTDAYLSKLQRLSWLTSVRDAKIKQKIRLLLFSEDDIHDFLSSKNNRIELLNAMLFRKDGGNSGKIYQVDPSDLFEVLRSSLGDEESRIAYDDFAVFDGQMVLKHNGAASLTISIKEQMSVYLEVFKPLKSHPELFREITLSHYGDMTWEEWDAQNINKGSS